jgi:nucleoid DNA-binding protein
MSVKDYLIRIMSVKEMTSEKVIEAVINHQFQSALVAMKDNDSVELSGFGKLFFNQKKAHRKMDKMLSKKRMFEQKANNPELSEQKRLSSTNKLNQTVSDIEVLKPKLKGYVENVFPDVRGVEEPSYPCIRYEDED